MPMTISPDATTHAKAWLKLVDAADATGSWKAAGESFRAAVTPDDWSAQLREARGPIDPVTSRTLAVEQQLTELPDAPPGQYVVQQYHSIYSNVNAVVETLTLHQGADGTWRVIGYFIR
jgi:hypothetical protein